MVLVEMIVMIAVMVLLPIVPAILLYYKLPNKTTVKGPFKGLDIQLTGAFAGYFLVLLLVVGFYVSFLSGRSITVPVYETWKVEGKIGLGDGAAIDEDIDIMVKPPDSDIDGEGSFYISDILLAEKKGENVIKLSIEKKGYSPLALFLSEKQPTGHGYTVVYSWKDKTISIKEPIVLRKQVDLGEYTLERTAPATPIEEVK